LAPQHETSCDSEITTKEDFDYWRKIIEEEQLRRLLTNSQQAKRS